MVQASRVMPVGVGVQFTHAVIQAIADEVGIDLLHIKGPAIDPALVQRVTDAESPADGTRFVRRGSTDADVWVRPSQADRLLVELSGRGWLIELPFQDDSTFEHAAMLTHRVLAPVDVHRRFPGIGLAPEHAFEVLWAERRSQPIAHCRCWVPSTTAQRLILLVNAARGKLVGNADILMAWESASDEVRAEVDALAVRMDAEVALAASTGRLDAYRDRKDYALWALLSTGSGSAAALWWARVRAQPTVALAVRMGFKQVFPSPRRVRAVAGADLSRVGVARAYARRAVQAVRELRGLLPDARTRADGR